MSLRRGTREPVIDLPSPEDDVKATSFGKLAKLRQLASAKRTGKRGCGLHMLRASREVAVQHQIRSAVDPIMPRTV